MPVLSAPSAAQTALTWGPVPGWGHCRPASCNTSRPWLVVMVRMIRFTHWEVAPQGAWLRPALASRGVPEWVYVDNGSAFVDAWLLRACAVLGIKLVHSRPRRPQGRGKVERFFRTVRDQFLVEITGDDRQAGTRAADLAELNRLFSAWVAVSYHRAVHSETGQAPLARWAAGVPDPLPLPSPAQLHEAFRWSERRTVRKTATVSLHGNLYQVDASLVRCVVELVFDPLR